MSPSIVPRLHITVEYQALYKFRVANAAFEPLLDILLRVYGGEFYTNFVTISESRLATQLSLSVNDVTKKLTVTRTKNHSIQPTKRSAAVAIYHSPARSNTVTTACHRFGRKKESIPRQSAGRGRVCNAPPSVSYTVIISVLWGRFSERCGVCDHCLLAKSTRKRSVSPSNEQHDRIRKLIHHFLTDHPVTADKLTAAMGTQNEEILHDAQSNAR